MVSRLRTTEDTPIVRARRAVAERKAALREAEEYRQVCERDWAARLGGAEIAIDEARDNWEHAFYDLKEAEAWLAKLLHRESMAERKHAAVEPAELGLSNETVFLIPSKG